MSMTHRVLGCALLAIHVALNAAPPAPDPAQTLEPLRHLLRSSGLTIPKASSCFGDYGQRGEPRIRDLLSSRLAYLNNGQNTITGACNATHCALEIRHAAGEDVASATVAFNVRNGLVNRRSLRCVLTP